MTLGDNFFFIVEEMLIFFANFANVLTNWKVSNVPNRFMFSLIFNSHA